MTKTMNKNDLRYIKTEKLIKDTYLSLKRKHGNHIRVNDLCKKAMINKSTFYAHYETIDHLHQKLCNEVIEEILVDSLKIDDLMNDIETFVVSIIKTLQANINLIEILFGDDKTKLVNSVENCLLLHFFKNKELKKKENEIIFAIGGAANILIAEQNKETIDIAINLIKKTIS